MKAQRLEYEHARPYTVTLKGRSSTSLAREELRRISKFDFFFIYMLITQNVQDVLLIQDIPDYINAGRGVATGGCHTPPKFLKTGKIRAIL